MNLEKLHRQQLRLTMWFAIVFGICALMLVATYFWLHVFMLVVIAFMFGPIFLFLTLIFGALTLNTLAKLKK